MPAYPKTYIFVDGTSGCFKTTAVSLLAGVRQSDVEAHYLDLFNMMQDFEVYKDKANCKSLDLAYSADVSMRIATALWRSERHVVFDRSPFSNVIYSRIIEHLKAGRTPSAAEWRTQLSEIFAPQMIAAASRHMVVVVSEDVDSVVERMRSRQNGIDFFTKEYIYLQNEAFRAVADLFQCPLVVADTPCEVVKFVNSLLPQIFDIQ